MKSSIRRLVSFAAALIAFSIPVLAAEVTFERDPSLPLVFLNVALKGGAVTDSEGHAGLTNFMGEMLLRGTRTKTKEQIDLALDQMGAQLAVETRSEAVILRGSVLAAQLDAFLALLGEIITQPSFPEGEIRKLRAEITSGLLEEQGTDSRLLSRKFTNFLFRGHPYGKPILGTIKDVANLNRPKVLGHYDLLVRDVNLLIVGSGDAEVSKIEQWSATLASARPGGEAIPIVAKPENSDGRRLLLVDKPDRTQTQIRTGQIGVQLTDSNYFPLYLGNHAFGGGSFSARMMVEVRVKRGWSYGAYSSFRHGRQPRSWEYYIFPATKDTPAALEFTLKMLEDLKEKGVTDAEFEIAKTSLINSDGFRYNTPEKRVENTLLEKTLDLPQGFMTTYAKNLSKLSVSDVNRALRDFVRPDRVSIAVLGTAKDLKLKLAKAAGIDESKIEVVPYTQD
jgi:zinc protease